MTDGIGRQFMLETQPRYMGRSDQAKGLPQPPLELSYDDTQPLIDLPAPADLEVEDVNLCDLIERRVSIRRYAAQPLALAELSYLLWCTQGVKESDRAYITRRTVPSAGARHAFETILLVNNVEGLQPGLYRFVASAHKLVALNLDEDIPSRVTDACMRQAQVSNSAVTFLWVAVCERMVWRYGQRGYRYLHLDAGHVCQNLYLAALAIDCGVCAIAAFYDKELNDVLALDGEEQFVIYLATVGKKR